VITCPGTMIDSGTQCTCNTTSYFHPEFHSCVACTDVHVNCTSCSYDATNIEGDCNACSFGTPSTDKRTCEGGCAPITNC